MKLEKALKNIIKGDIAVDGATLKEYSHDASLFEIRPNIVIFPKDVEDIKGLVRFASQRPDATGQKLSLTARSGGTDMTGGPLTESAVIDVTKYLNQIKEIGEDYAVTEPGVFYRDFEKETLKRGLLLPSYPASREICTVGGMVANNSGGEKTLAYGKTEDYVLELRAVLSDGNEYSFEPLNKANLQLKLAQNNFEGGIYRKMYKLVTENYKPLQEAKPKVSKNSAGYYLWNIWDGRTFDLTKLLVGSQGTLGIITEIKFKLIKPKKHSRLAVIFLKDLQSLIGIIQLVMKFNPESFESFDDNTLKIVLRYLPSLVKLLKKNVFRLAWNFLPEFWMFVSGGTPKLILLAEFTDDKEESLENKLLELKEELAKFDVKSRILASEEEARKYWVMRRESFNLLRHHLKNKRTAPFIDDFIVKVEKLPEFLPKLNKILNQYDMIYTIAGHVGNGNFHIIPLMNLSDPKNREIIKDLSERVYDLVLAYGGSITAEHNDGLIRSPYLKKMYGEEIYELFKETKKVFDPANIFNPGKKVNANLDYAFEHLAKTS